MLIQCVVHTSLFFIPWPKILSSKSHRYAMCVFSSIRLSLSLLDPSMCFTWRKIRSISKQGKGKVTRRRWGGWTIFKEMSYSQSGLPHELTDKLGMTVSRKDILKERKKNWKKLNWSLLNYPFYIILLPLDKVLTGLRLILSDTGDLDEDNGGGVYRSWRGFDGNYKKQTNNN